MQDEHLVEQSRDFYRRQGRQYAHVAHTFKQSVYSSPSHPIITDDWALLSYALTLVTGRTCLDAGCGAGGRDVFELWRRGFDAYGIDAMSENIALTRELHPEIADRVSVADLCEPLPFADASFDLVLCNAVIQHIPRGNTLEVTLPELVRVLRPGGILQLMFKNGEGVLSLHDADYGETRTFLLYDEHELASRLARLDVDTVESRDEHEPGGFMYFTDPKGARHCVFHARKAGSAMETGSTS
ncbi:class I SAM-dependent methyltransferase [Chloroflexota bacterium]